MDARRRVTVLAAVCGLSLGVGIPALGLTALPHTETDDGYVVWVHPGAHALLLRRSHEHGRPRDLLVHLPEHADLRVAPGGEPVSALRPGQRVRVRIGRRSHWLHRIALER